MTDRRCNRCPDLHHQIYDLVVERDAANYRIATLEAQLAESERLHTELAHVHGMAMRNR